MLRACTSNFVDVARSTWKVERAWCTVQWAGYPTETVISHATQISECFQSPVSLSVIQAAENIVGPNAMWANGRLWILTRYCLKVYWNPGAHNLFLCCRTTGRTAQGYAGWTPVQQCAPSGGSAVQSICARGYLSVSCTTATIDTNVWNYRIFYLISEGVDSYHKVLKPWKLNH
jgi:hypothetical protein